MGNDDYGLTLTIQNGDFIYSSDGKPLNDHDRNELRKALMKLGVRGITLDMKGFEE